jgi:hypothetical protein
LDEAVADKSARVDGTGIVFSGASLR